MQQSRSGLQARRSCSQSMCRPSGIATSRSPGQTGACLTGKMPHLIHPCHCTEHCGVSRPALSLHYFSSNVSDKEGTGDAGKTPHRAQHVCKVQTLAVVPLMRKIVSVIAGCCTPMPMILLREERGQRRQTVLPCGTTLVRSPAPS